MRNFTIPEACLIVGTVILGSGTFLALEVARLQHRQVAEGEAIAAVVDAQPASPAPAVQATLPSSAPLAPQPAPAAPRVDKRHGQRADAVRAKRPAPTLDGDCEGSSDPLCGAL